MLSHTDLWKYVHPAGAEASGAMVVSIPPDQGRHVLTRASSSQNLVAKCTQQEQSTSGLRPEPS